VPFTARNVGEDAASRGELIARTGRMAVPVIVVEYGAFAAEADED